jgi:gas vesicle protein
MNVYDLYDMFLDALPIRRKSRADWIVPASIGLGVGAAIGVGVGMILAPRSGFETRQRLREGATQLKEKARVAAEKAKDQIAAKANGVSEQLGYEPSREMR